jgi:hypothetical protein
MIRRAVPVAVSRAEEAVRRIALAALLALTVLLVAATPAVADDTRCGAPFDPADPMAEPEVLGPVVVDNVIVPSGTLCVLAGTQVLGNVLAEPASGLFLDGTNVRGSVEVKEDALTGAFESTIGGSYKCDNCFFEDVIDSTVGGNVDITGADDGDFIINSEIAGNVHIEESSAGAFAFVVEDNTIGGDLKFEKNSGPTGISRNTILGDLQIFENNVAGAFCPPPPPPGEEPPLCPVLENGHFNENQVDGDMQIFKNEGSSEVLNNMIRENLQCFENSPAPASAGNTAREKQGQCLA